MQFFIFLGENGENVNFLLTKPHTECECWWHQDASFEPQPLTALIGRACKKLRPLFGFIHSRPIGGHLGRHLVFDSFPVLWFWHSFSIIIITVTVTSMLFSTCNCTRNSWKTFSSNFLGVQPYFVVYLPDYYIIWVFWKHADVDDMQRWSWVRLQLWSDRSHITNRAL